MEKEPKIKLEEKEELSETEQIEQGKNNLLQEIDSAIEKQNDELFKQEANHLKEIMEKMLEVAVSEERSIKFILSLIKFTKSEIEELERVCDSRMDIISDKETRIKHWREHQYDVFGMTFPEKWKEIADL